jgi:hypothetical protein
MLGMLKRHEVEILLKEFEDALFDHVSLPRDLIITSAIVP